MHFVLSVVEWCLYLIVNFTNILKYQCGRNITIKKFSYAYKYQVFEWCTLLQTNLQGILRLGNHTMSFVAIHKGEYKHILCYLYCNRILFLIKDGEPIPDSPSLYNPIFPLTRTIISYFYTIMVFVFLIWLSSLLWIVTQAYLKFISIATI